MKNGTLHSMSGMTSTLTLSKSTSKLTVLDKISENLHQHQKGNQSSHLYLEEMYKIYSF